MEPKSLLFDICEFIPLLLYLHYGRKPIKLGPFVFSVGKKFQLKSSSLNASTPLYMMNIMKMVSP